MIGSIITLSRAPPLLDDYTFARQTALSASIIWMSSREREIGEAACGRWSIKEESRRGQERDVV